jgi:hypothetical protein
MSLHPVDMHAISNLSGGNAPPLFYALGTHESTALALASATLYAERQVAKLGVAI